MTSLHDRRRRTLNTLCSAMPRKVLLCAAFLSAGLLTAGDRLPFFSNRERR